MRPFIYQRAADPALFSSPAPPAASAKFAATNRLAGKLHSWLEAPRSLI